MARIAEKLKDRQGVSLLIALMYFLVSLTIGTIVLTAATASYGKLSSLRRREQDYLNVSSAARLLRDQIVGSEFKFTIEETDSGDAAIKRKYEYKNFSISDMKDTMQSCLSVVLDSDAEDHTASKSIVLDSIQLEDSSDKVTGKLIIQDSAQILIYLWIEEGTGADAKKRHPVLVTLNSDPPAIVQTITEDVTTNSDGTEEIETTIITTTTYSWKESGASIHQVTLNEKGEFDETEATNESGGI